MRFSSFLKCGFIIAAFIGISNILAQSDRISNLPYYNFGKGIGLTTPDSLFQVNMRFRVQSRATFSREDGHNIFDGQIRRLRLRFDGFIGNPNISYLIQLSFAPGDVGATELGENLNVIRDAAIFYRFTNQLRFGFGQTKLPGNRQRVNSSSALQLTDRSINNASFNIDRDFGIFINYLNEKQNTFSYNVNTAISTGDGRNYTKNPDDGLAYTAKLEILPFGIFSNNGVYFEGDLAREEKFKLMLSGVYSYNNKAKRTGGTIGSNLASPKNLTSIFFDLMAKYRGFGFMSMYASRSTDNPLDQSGNNIFAGSGWDFQSSYLNKYNIETIARYSFQTPDDALNIFQKREQITIGLTKYLREHIFKLQLEGGIQITHNRDTTRDKIPMVRFQIEMGI